MNTIETEPVKSIPQPVSFILITCDRPLLIQKQIKSLPTNVEIIVMDDSDYLINYPPNVKVDYHKGKLGVINCLNIAIAKCSNDIIIILPDDVSINDTENFIRDLLLWFKISPAPILGFNIMDKYNKIRPSWITRKIMWFLCGQVYPERGNFIKTNSNMFTCSFAFNKKRLNKYFDTNYI